MTSEITLFRILSEASTASGVRRIEAIAGLVAAKHAREAMQTTHEVSQLLGARPDEIIAKLTQLLDENKQLKKAAQKASEAQLHERLTSEAAKILSTAKQTGEFTIASAILENINKDALRHLGDMLKEKITSGCWFLCATDENTVHFLAGATPNATKRGAHAGNIVREAAKLCGGGGGGKPGYAQAGGRDVSRAKEAVQLAVEGFVAALS